MGFAGGGGGGGGRGCPLTVDVDELLSHRHDRWRHAAHEETDAARAHIDDNVVPAEEDGH